MQGVHAGHDEVEGEKKLGFLRVDRDLLTVVVELVCKVERRSGHMVLLEFLFVLETLDDEEGHPQQYRNNEIADQHFALARFRRFHRQYNRNRADDKDGCINCSEPNVELLASGREGVEVGDAVDEIAAEHAAEEHDLGHQEQPHAKRGGVLLLLSVRELVNQRWIMSFVSHGRNLGRRWTIVQREPPVPLGLESRRSYKPPRSRRESRQN